MLIIGITGGVGSGKSSILKYLKSAYGAVIIEADNVGRMLQQRGNEAFDKIVENFGTDSIASDGELDRAYLAQLIYSDEKNRNLMNSIVHPLVEKYIIDQIENEYSSGTAFLVIESAILFESGLDCLCDELWFIYADKEIRIKRLMESRGYSRNKCLMIMDSQLRDEAFFNLCSVSIDNSLSIEYSYRQIDEEFHRIKDE